MAGAPPRRPDFRRIVDGRCTVHRHGRGRCPASATSPNAAHVVGPEFIRLFTAISGDRNPLHYDDAAARASRFGEIVVQGGVTSAILNAVVAEALPGPGTVFLHVDWRFTAPVRPGDTITGRVEVTEVRADKPITTLATRVTGRTASSHSRARPSATPCGLHGAGARARPGRLTAVVSGGGGTSSTARLNASGCSQYRGVADVGQHDGRRARDARREELHRRRRAGHVGAAGQQQRRHAQAFE